ncbi:MAG: tRNA (adenosine(37)-N6)-threonylcarbamoyltransferase complex dimerization subunit type 1 TsaB [Clostridia bacterium]|nr:tRNA (adenosine(37)-N6)-threonylcarbamoyltransferase complex dimerization subunit type 1 TsaB [Clostridia bacterium]
MTVLAIDSSGAAASAAVTDDEKLLSSFSVASAEKHSATLLPMAERALECAGKKISDVDLFAVVAGPGSFTGVRIGVSLVKGLAFGSGKPIASVSSLEALAYNLCGFDGIACPVMDARRGQFYNALFRGGKRLTGDRLIPAVELEKELAAYDCPVYMTGDGYALARSLIRADNIRETPHRLTVSDAYSAAVCGLNNYRAGREIYTDETLQPVYLRPSQAERTRNERTKENG